MRRWLPLAWAAIALLAAVGSAGADALQDIDKAVAQLGAFVRRTVPDQEGISVAVLPFSSDRRGRVVLGDRLKTELELNLAAAYSRTRVVGRVDGRAAYTVAGEIQSYPGTIRIICRITRPDGSLGGGSRADIPASPELESLLEAVSEKRTPSDGLEGGEDPLEPDDAPGFEVQVPEGEIQLYSRAVTQGDIDRFRFYVGGEITAVLEAQTTVDLQLLLFREGENVPFEVAGGRGSESLRLTVNLTGGYYIVEVLAYDLNVTGRYTLAIDLSGHSNDTYEPDDQREQAGQIVPGKPQERALLPGDVDWVELVYTVPGFYEVYTDGLQVDTLIQITDADGRTVAADDNSGASANAYAGVFLGTRRTYVRVSAKGRLDRGSYVLAFDKVEPPQVYPAAQAQAYRVLGRPLLLQLRILQPGRYLVRAIPEFRFSMGRQPPAAELKLFALPTMRESVGQDSLYVLNSGDYLVSVSLEDGAADDFALCVAPEAQAEACRRSVGGSGDGRTNR